MYRPGVARVVLETAVSHSLCAGLLLAPAKGFGKGFFCPFCHKMDFLAVLAHFKKYVVAMTKSQNSHIISLNFYASSLML